MIVFYFPNLASALKRKIGSTRQSLAPTSLVNSFGLKKIEPDNADTETGLLYDDYLRTLMADVLVKKKAKENEKKILNQLASLSKEQDLGDEKLMKMKSREKDINYLSALQNYLDTLVTQIRSECGEEIFFFFFICHLENKKEKKALIVKFIFNF